MKHNFSRANQQEVLHTFQKKKNPIRIFEEQGGGQPIFRVLLKILLPPLTLSVSWYVLFSLFFFLFPISKQPLDNFWL